MKESESWLRELRERYDEVPVAYMEGFQYMKDNSGRIMELRKQMEPLIDMELRYMDELDFITEVDGLDALRHELRVIIDAAERYNEKIRGFVLYVDSFLETLQDASGRNRKVYDRFRKSQSEAFSMLVDYGAQMDRLGFRPKANEL